MDERTVECAIVGGGAAGLSAALVLGRALTSTLVIDAGRQSNLPAAAVGGLLGFTGSPAELYAAAAAQLAELPDVGRVADTVTRGGGGAGGFTLDLASGGRVRARVVILATGMDYGPPDLPGLAPLWGDTAFHCPFCHGHEVRGLPLAVLGAGDEGGERALLLRRWSDDVVLLTDGADAPGPAVRARLDARGIPVEPRGVAGLEDRPGDGPAARPRLAAVVLADGTRLPRAGVMVPAAMAPNDDLATALGARRDERGGVAVDAMGRTGVPGLFAAGDVAPRVPQVSTAIAAGAVVAAAVVKELVEAAPAG
jgi:thioredoxin reductase